MARRLLTSLTPDLRPLRGSRDYRLLVSGTLVTGLGTQAALVALPYQVYVVSHKPVLVGLLGLVELGPLVAASLFGGAWADRVDRRNLLLLIQVALVAVAGGLAAAAFVGHPPVWLLYVLAAALAGASAFERVTRSAIVPNVVPPESIRAAVSTTFGINQLTIVVGPGLGGLLIAALGVGAAYTADAASCLGMVAAAASVALGILAGLFQCRDPEDGTVLAYAGGSDAVRETADWVAAEARKHGLELSPDDLDEVCPDWLPL